MEYLNKENNSQSKLIAAWLSFMLCGVLFFTLVVPFVLDKHEEERQWQAERLCAIYGVCNSKRGA